MNKRQVTTKKVLFYFLSLVVGVILSFLLVLLFNIFAKDVILFFNAIKISCLASVFGFSIWKIFNKGNFFEDFVVYLSELFICLFMVYIGPTTVDRSLSSFMIFYSVENKKLPNAIKNEKYINDYFERRYKDGINIGYFKCDKDFCYPTKKAQIIYYAFYPIGKVTKTLENYYDFKKMMNE